MFDAGLVFFGNPMIVFKFTQEQEHILGALQTIAEIINRRMFPVQKTLAISPAIPRHAALLRVLTTSTKASPKPHSPRPSQIESLNHCMGFFSAQKLNMRNAP
jgi:hypothetical protein